MLAAVAGATLAPAPATAATAQTEQTITKTYDTTFVRDTGRGFPIEGGVLKLTLTKEGYINGYYSPPDSVAFIPVVGGRNGSDVWFDIGNSTQTTHVTGTLQGSEIIGSAVEPGGQFYRFKAVPAV